MVQSKPQNTSDNTCVDGVGGKGVGEGVRNSGGKVSGSQKRAKGTRPQPELVPIVEEEEDSGGESRRAKGNKIRAKVVISKGQDKRTEGQGLSQRAKRSRGGQSSAETEAPVHKTPPITGKRKRETDKPRYVCFIEYWASSDIMMTGLQ
jgi:hypothetical protein